MVSFFNPMVFLENTPIPLHIVLMAEEIYFSPPFSINKVEGSLALSRACSFIQGEQSPSYFSVMRIAPLCVPDNFWTKSPEKRTRERDVSPRSLNCAFFLHRSFAVVVVPSA
jgi:hypothetical protein